MTDRKIRKEDIEEYLAQVKAAVKLGRYRLDRNLKRQDNINLEVNDMTEHRKWDFCTGCRRETEYMFQKKI